MRLGCFRTKICLTAHRPTHNIEVSPGRPAHPPRPSPDPKEVAMTTLSELWADDQGQDSAEYAAMLVAALVIVLGTILLGRR